MLLSLVFLTFVFGLAGVRHSEAIAERYHSLSQHSWRPYLPSLPKLTTTPFKTPSNTTLQLENGEIDHLPPKLEKTTPNFHLLMTSERDSDAFCKSTLSAMLLNYPPPTAVTFGQKSMRNGRKESQTLHEIREYLHNAKLVHDEDLLLIVDGQDTWFQLPSDVIIKQYEAVVEYANARLLRKYGLDEHKRQKFNQTIVFGAEKVCEGDDLACKYAPESILPHDMYSASETPTGTADLPAKYLNSRVVMGPAKDLRVFFDAALEKFERHNSEKQTIQSVLSTMFGEQQLQRDAVLTQGRSATSKLRAWAGRPADEHKAAERRLDAANGTISLDEKCEYSIGLDYTHTLFQPLMYTVPDELVPLRHENSTKLLKYRHPKTITPQLSLPPTLGTSKLPFWSPNLHLHNPSPDTNQPAYIEKLECSNELDRLPNRHTTWANISLIQNTFTGAIPALILRVPDSTHNSKTPGTTSSQISFKSLWFARHKRALLRQYFRTPQSPNGYHNSVVGGDRFWDQRGGRGGIWTSQEQMWLPWGEVDGVCGTLAHLKQVFRDGKGVWMHELEPDNEGQRTRDEEEYKKTLEEKKKKAEEREQEKIKIAAENAKKEHDQAEEEKLHKQKLEQEERQKQQDQAEREKANVERLRKIEEEKKLAQEDREAIELLEKQGQGETGTAGSTRRTKRWAA